MPGALIRVVPTTLYLVLVLASIPISFQIGGTQCGLSFTVALFSLYFVTTTLRVLLNQSRNKLLRFLSYFFFVQHLFIPSLLFMFINEEPMPAYDMYVVAPWRSIIVHSTPFFTLLEGLFTILVIQAIGETHNYMKQRSNVWTIMSLMSSGSVITTSVYYLYKIYPTDVFSPQTASVLGAVLAIVMGLGLYGILSKSGSVIESSMFFAYIVKLIYELSPELSSSAMEEIAMMIQSAAQLRFFPKMTLETGLIVPESLLTVADFIQRTGKSITPSIIVNLLYRVAVFYAATRIIPALQPAAVYDRRRAKRSGRFLQMIYLYSPCIVIAIFTHLMLQYAGELKEELTVWGWWSDNKVIVNPWFFWNWCNLFFTVGIYGVEIFSAEEHWKSE